jgi:putative transposase
LVDLAGKTAGPLSQEEDREEAALPAVIDLVSRMPKATGLVEVVDDLDVFDRYYDEHPDEDAFEVFHE